MSTQPRPIPPGLATAFARGLRRPGPMGDAIQSVLDAAARDYAAEGAGTTSALWWALYADRGRISLRLQYLYYQREAYTDLERRLIEFVTNSGAGVTRADSDVIKNVAALRDQAQKDIDQLETQSGACRVPAVGTLTAAVPTRARPVYGDPNSPVYRGDPLARYGPSGW